MMIGKYEILGELGKGGMGTVLLAYDTVLDCRVAIKAVRAEAVDPTMLGELEHRLLHEARAAAKLDHPGIVSIREFLREGDSGYIVMKFVQGKTLDHAVPLSAPVDPEFVLRIVRESAAALDHAHARNIVHRDIKPSNIMIDDETGAVQITDFGIAKILDGEQRTEPGMIVGTFEYMAPERLSDGKVDGRSDQFSLAVLAHRMLTGAPIYSAATIRRLSYQIAAEPPPSAHGLNPALPMAVDQVLATALAKDPALRYPSCAAFAAALDAAFNPSAQPVTAKTGAWSPGRGATTQIPAAGDPAQDQGSAPSKSRLLLIGGIAVAAIVIFVAIFMIARPHPAPTVPATPSTTAAATATPAAVTSGTAAASLTTPTGEMLLVKAGEALLGPDRKPANVPAFYIDKTEVTNEAYLAFCKATGRAAPKDAEQSPLGNPVVNVTFNDANAFAQWAGKRLPTASEWEKAARGAAGQAYPWGNDWKDGVANIPAEPKAKLRLETADTLPAGASPYGALNMIGNVWEWVATADQPDDTAFQQLKGVFKNLQPPLARTEPMYQTRGGSFRYWLPDRRALLYDGLVMPARLSLPDLGFRCAKNP